MYKKSLLTLIIIALLSISAYSQDVIYKSDKTEIKAKVVEITEDAIKYKRWDNQDGPLVSIKKAQVFMIIYKNGQKEMFEEEEKAVTTTTSTTKRETAKATKTSSNYKKPVENYLSFAFKGRFDLMDQNKNVIEKDLKKERMYELLQDVPNGIQQYDQYRKTFKTGNILANVGGGVCALGFGIAIYQIIRVAGSDMNKNYSFTPVYIGSGLMLAGLGTTVYGLVLGGISKKQGYKIDAAYNKHQKGLTFKAGITGNGVGLVMGF